MEGISETSKKYLQALCESFDEWLESQKKEGDEEEEEKDYKLLARIFNKEMIKVPRQSKNADGQSTVSKPQSNQFLYKNLEELKAAQEELEKPLCHRKGTRNTAKDRYCGLEATNDDEEEDENNWLCKKCYENKVKVELNKKNRKRAIAETKLEMAEKDVENTKVLLNKKFSKKRTDDSPGKKLKKPSDVPSAATKETLEFEELSLSGYYRTDERAMKNFVFVKDEDGAYTLVGKLAPDTDYDDLKKENLSESVIPVKSFEVNSLKKNHGIGYTKLEDYLKMINSEEEKSEEEEEAPAPKSKEKKTPKSKDKGEDESSGDEKKKKKDDSEDIASNSGDEKKPKAAAKTSFFRKEKK